MLLDTQERSLTTSGVMEVKRATIKTSPKIFNFFADQTYANKPRAICRELVANAHDSHVMAGKPDLPVEVWLPTILDPVFRVRDHGLGMAHDFMMNEFMCYADGSTKDQSNVAIGGFGIGSKSPFAYVDQYTVTSRYNGIEGAYSVFKDAEGIPSIGCLGQRPTTEPNGVEVSFPVKPEDFSTFEEAAFEALQHFQPLPDIKNATEGAFIPPVYIAQGTNWAMRPKEGDLNVIMGGVPYPVAAGNLTYKFPSDSPARKILSYGLDLRVPIGTCSVALSREALSYDDRTVEALRIACEGVVDEVAEKMSTMFEGIDTRWQAAEALYREVGKHSYGSRATFLSEHARWNGQPLKKTIEFPTLTSRQYGDGPVHPTWGYDLWIIESAENRYSRRARGAKKIGSSRFAIPTGNFTPGETGYVIIDDLPNKPKHKAVRKIKEFAEENDGATILVIRPWEHDGATALQIIDGLGGPPPHKVIYTSSLPEPYVEKVVRVRRDGTVRPKVRMFTYDGRRHSWKYGDAANNINPGQYGLSGVEEIPYSEQPETGILVVMETFKLPSDLRGLMSSGLIDWSELRFVNVGDAKKLKGWTDYKVEHERRKKEALAEYPDLAKRAGLFNDSTLSHIFDFFRRHPETDFTSGKPLGRIFKLYKQYIEPYDARQQKLARFITPKLPAGVKPEELLEAFNTKQWKANRLLNCLSTIMDEEDMRLFQENL